MITYKVFHATSPALTAMITTDVEGVRAYVSESGELEIYDAPGQPKARFARGMWTHYVSTDQPGAHEVVFIEPAVAA